MILSFRVYAPLRRSPELLRQVRLGEHGTDVVWTDETDMAADTLWRLAREQAGLRLSSAKRLDDGGPAWTLRHGCGAAVIERAGGFVAKYMGAGELAHFGYPRADEHHAERAVRAGLALVQAAAGIDTAAGHAQAASAGREAPGKIRIL